MVGVGEVLSEDGGEGARKGRRRKTKKKDKADDEDAIPTDPDQLPPFALPAGEADTNEPEEPLRRTSTSQNSKTDENESFAFDLFYTRFSLILDGVLTSLATFTKQGWQMYVIAVVIPLAAGTGSTAKGTMLQMCTPEQRTDALSAISLLEMIGRLSTTSLFGLVFSGFAELGKPGLTFAVNAGCAVLGFLVLLFARFPPRGAVRWTREDGNEDENAGE